MNWVKDLVDYISALFKWWVIVLPWQEGIRVRFGKQERHIRKGIYLKLPIIDTVFIQNVRFKYTQMPIQTVTTKDGITVTLNASIGWQIRDIKKMYNGISNPDATMTTIAMAKISDYVATHTMSDLKPANLETELDLEKYGIEANMKICSFAVVKTYRLIQDNTWMPTGKEFEI